MNEIKKIAREAQRALDKLANGKSYPAKYVCERVDLAKANNPGDVTLGYARDIFRKRASSQKFFTEKEITEVYNQTSGLSSGNSVFREALGDLMTASPVAAMIPKKAGLKSRISYENELKPLYGESELSKELSGVFSLDKKASFSVLSDTTLTKAAKFAKVQLTSLGCAPSSVSVSRSNDHFVLCTASIDTSDFTQVNVQIPVQVTNGIPSIPQAFIQDDKLVKLNKENLYVFIKDTNNYKKKAAQSNFAGQRALGSLKVSTPDIPEALSRYADLDNQLIAAASSFSSSEVSRANAVIASELSALGLGNAQVKLANSDNKSLYYQASIPAPGGQVFADISVSMPNGSPVIPTTFKMAGELFRLNRSGLRSALRKAEASGRINSVSREVESMERLNYSQLIGEMEKGVASSDFKKAEDALLSIQARFDQTQHLAALDHFSKLLKHASSSSSREAMIKAAVNRGELINIPTSVQLYSPKLGLPVSKIAFDSKGRLVPATREMISGSLSETGAMISTSKISLS